MLRLVALVRTDVSQELSASILSLRSVRQFLVTANVIPSSPIFVTLMVETLLSSETSVLTRATRRDIPESAILQSHSSENLRPYLLYLLLYFRIMVSSGMLRRVANVRKGVLVV
jgi:hypothetical protein